MRKDTNGSPLFKNKNGTLTRYAFACGYVEQVDLKVKPYTFKTLALDGLWHVKGMINGVRFWETFETLTAARKYYNSVKLEGVKNGN